MPYSYVDMTYPADPLTLNLDQTKTHRIEFMVDLPSNTYMTIEFIGAIEVIANERQVLASLTFST